MARITNTQRIAQLEAQLADQKALLADQSAKMEQMLALLAGTPPTPPAPPAKAKSTSRAKSKAKSHPRAKKTAKWNYFACGRANCGIMREALRERLGQPAGKSWNQLTALAEEMKVSYADIVAPFGG